MNLSGASEDKFGANVECEYADDIIESVKINIPVQADKETFIIDPENEAFASYIGTYYTYMHSTKKMENSYLEGVLEISKQAGKCRAKFVLYTNKEKTNHKDYIGSCIYAPKNQTMYIILAGCNEICFLNMRYKQFRQYCGTAPLYCRLAYVLTTSLDNFSPAVQKIFVCRKSLCDEQLKVVLSHLKLTDGDIYIKENEFNSLKDYFDTEDWDKYCKYVNKEMVYMIRQMNLLGKGNCFSPEVVEFLGMLKDKSENCYKALYTDDYDDDMLFGYLHEK